MISRILLLLIVLFCTVPLSAVPAGIVTRDGIHLKLNGRNHYFSGTNSYDFFTKDKAAVDARMAEMASDYVKVLRTWAYSHESGYAFELPKGVFNESEFRVFDYVMKSARDHNIRVIIGLEDYWGAYGGINSRLKWEGLSSDSPRDKAEFFRNAGCKASYKEFLKHIVNRVNVYTNIAYKDDPYLFSWELINEPRFQDAGEDDTGTTLRKWTDEMAALIHSMDPNHMVSLGIEGHGTNYGYGGDEGNPFVYLHQSPYIDFATGHMYPDETWANLSPSAAAKVIKLWIKDAHEVCGKPFVLEEFNSRKDHLVYWRLMLGMIEVADAAGDAFWGYAPCSPTCEFCICHGHPLFAQIFHAHAKLMNSKH